VVDGAVLQRPILSQGVIVLAGLLVAAVAGLVLLAMKTGSVPGATQADVPPEAPTQLAADAVSADLIQLRWAPVDRATGYQVLVVDEATQAQLNELPVRGLSTALPAKVDKPLTKVCYRVVALRRNLTSQPSDTQCATTRDGLLEPPTDVRVVPAEAGYAVSWTDDELNAHVILLDGSPVGQPIPVGVSQVSNLPVPAGHHCVQVLGQRGQTVSSRPSPDPPGVCVDVNSPSPSASAPGGQPGGGPGGTGSTTTSPSGSPGTLTGWVAVVGPPYQEQPLAQATLQRVQATGATAQIVPVTALPQLGAKFGLFVVATGFTSQEQAQQFCTGLPPDLLQPGAPTPCQPVQAPG
jgi:hypothetical protein